MKRRRAAFILVLGLAAASADATDERAALVARRLAEPAPLNGRLDSRVWRQAAAGELELPGDARAADATPREAGRVRAAWDEQHLYVAIDLVDHDVKSSSTADGQSHHRNGDVAEIFLKPADRPWYWELHVTPRGWLSAMYWSGPVSTRPPGYDPRVSPRFFKAAVDVRGTVKQAGDRDEGWTVEAAIPWAALYRDESARRPADEPWLLFIGRYNYGSTPGAELASWPPVPITSFHMTERYGRLILQDAVE
jgi:hypothetical protein